MEYAVKRDICSISHRGKYFQALYSEATRNIRLLMNIPPSVHIFFISSSLEAMERIIQNTVFESSFHFVNGAFSKKWFLFASALGKKPEKIEVDFGKGFNLASITVPKHTELICLTHNETSTGVSVPLEEVRSLKVRHPASLIAVDVVSSAPYPSLDFSVIDMAFFSVQKGFGLPAGLGVLLVNDRAIQKSQVVSRTIPVGTYHTFVSLLAMSEKCQTPETPNVLGIYLLGNVCRDMLKKGRETICRQTDLKADALYDFAGKSKTFAPFVLEKKFRSPTTIVLSVPNQGSSRVIEDLKKKGCIVGSGYGVFKESHIRIANFPAHSMRNVTTLIRGLKSFETLL